MALFNDCHRTAPLERRHGARFDHMLPSYVTGCDQSGIAAKLISRA